MRILYPFEKLEVWKLSMELALEIYTQTRNFPTEEKFGMTTQIRRAANSVSANIAEGSSRFSNKDRARFFQISYSSLMEVLNFLILAEKLNYMDKETLANLRLSIDELANKINAYYRKINVD